jgi:outer membrane protein assembly factor BamB
MPERLSMSKSREAIYVGIRGTVLALDRSSGAEMWRADLKKGDFVNIVLDGDVLLAATKGELFCLDSTTGKVLWKNELKGLGRGLMTVATADSPFGSVVPNVAKKLRDDAAAAGAAAVASS